MVSFKYLKTRDVAGQTKWLAVPQITDRAMFKLLPAGDMNPAYQNGLMRLGAARIRTVAATRQIQRPDADQARDDDRELYADFVVQDWEGILDDEGNEVPFSRENAKEFFALLPAWIFDRIRIFCMMPENFLQPNALAIKEKVGNSVSGSSGS